LGAPDVAADATEGLAIIGRALARKTVSGRTSEVLWTEDVSSSLKFRGSKCCGEEVVVDNDLIENEVFLA
jgi:hypothetical protein